MGFSLNVLGAYTDPETDSISQTKKKKKKEYPLKKFIYVLVCKIETTVYKYFIV